MKSKWYFGTLLAAFAFFVASQQQIAVPNQQIDFHFSDQQATVSQTEVVISAIKNQLQVIGAKNTQVTEQNGTLKITYYSDVDVENVKAILLHNQETVYLDDNKYSNQSYNLDVSEIKTSTPSGAGFDGDYMVEAKQEYLRASQVVLTFSAIAENTLQLTLPSFTTHKVNTNISISIDKGTFNIPEGRAGPIA